MVTGGFFLFFQRKHANHLLLTNDQPSGSWITENDGQEDLHPPFKQSKLTFGHSTSQSTVSKLIFEIVIDDVQPFSLVEQAYFKRLVEGISGGKTVMCRKTLVQRIEREFAAMKDILTAKLQKVTNVCTTADLWSAHNRRFFWHDMPLDWGGYNGEEVCSIGLCTSDGTSYFQ